MHLAESTDELRLLSTGDGPFQELLEERGMWDAGSDSTHGSTPADYIRLLARAPRSLVIHGNYLTGEEIRLVARQSDRMAIVYCPRTHSYFGHDAYPLGEMLAAGARVVLGTDSRASNPDLSILAELRLAAELHPGVSPEQLLRMATADAAEALGLAGEVGTLSAGKRADLVALPCSARTVEPLAGLLQHQVIPLAVWQAGEKATQELP